MSQIPSSSTSSTNFEAIFTAALEAYKKQTKNDITAHPLAAQLKSCDSPGAVLDLLQAQVQAFDKSQSGNKRLTNWLDPTVNVLFAFSTTLGNAVGLVYPPSNAIFAGIGVLLQAVKDVRASQDALIDLFGRMDNFFKRLEKHIEVRPTAAMTDIIVKIMVEVLSILGIVTKEIGQGTMKKYLKKLVGRKDVEDALQRLDKLTQAEAFMAAAETLAIARGIDAKVEDVDGKVQGVDERVQSVDTKVEGINDKVQDVDSKVQDVDSRVQGVDTKVQSVDGKVQGIDTKVEGVDNKVQGVDSRVRTVDSNVQGVDHKIGSVIQGVKETGIAIQQVVDQVSDLNKNEIRKDLRKWIAPPDPSVNYNSASGAHHEGTASWCIKGSTLANWKSSGSLLWIHGRPGSGKSILSSVIIRDIKSMSDSGSAFLAYFYFDFKNKEKQDSRALLSSLLFQLSDQSDIFLSALFSLYSAHKKGSEQPTVNSLAECLKDTLRSMGPVPIYLVMDALDECPNDSGIPTPREMVMDLVKELVNLRRPDLRLCTTSRPEFDIRNVFDTLATQQLSIHDESGQRQDINNYVTFVVHSDRRMKNWRDDDRDAVIETMTKKADGMFRWVFCQLEVLRHCFPANLRQILAELPRSLDETYMRIIKEINHVNRALAYRLLQCLTVAHRPLRVEELAEVLAFDLSTGGIPKLVAGWRWEDQEEAVLSACSSLVSVIVDKGFRIVQFSHFSVKEFLTSDRLESCAGEMSRFYIPIEPSHVILAQACLGVLLRLGPMYDPADEESIEDVERIPFCQYAAEYWYRHAEIGNVESHIKDAMDDFFDADKPHFSTWVRLRSQYDRLLSDLMTAKQGGGLPSAAPLYFAARRGFRGVVERLIIKHPQQVKAWVGSCGTPLHASVLGGHIEVAQLLFERGADINSRSALTWTRLHLNPPSGSKWTPLHIASQEGHREIGKWLLGRGAHTNSQDISGKTPLHFAASRGHLEVCQILLQRSAKVDSRDHFGCTPLLRALEGENPDLGILRLLLDHNAHVNVSSKGGDTPLHLAVSHRNLEACRMLLERNAEVNSRNHDGCTPLLLALRKRYTDFSQVLLDHNADVHMPDKSGNTSLHFAASGGHLEICRILLKRNAEVNSRNHDRLSPLLNASQSGHHDISRLLLDHNADVHMPDKSGNTPLHFAASRGHLEVCRILLERNAEVNSRNNEGSTPLLLALKLRQRYYGVQRLLLDHNADVHMPDKNGSTPLHFAATGGHLEVCRILLERHAEVNSQNNEGSTPLLLALLPGHYGVSQFLLDHNADVHIPDKSGNTPLHFAASGGHLEVCRILLERNAEVSSRNRDRSTPFLKASWGGNPDVLRLLLDHNADNRVNDKSGNTPLHLAASRGHLEVCRILLERNAEVNSRNHDRLSPLLGASQSGHHDISRLLLDHNADVHMHDKSGNTSLHLAASGGHLGVCRILLERGAKVNSRNNKGSTPLLLAFKLGQPYHGVQRLLLGHNADVRVHDRNGNTPLHLAASHGRLEVCRILLERNAKVNARNNKGSTPLHRAARGHRSRGLGLRAPRLRVTNSDVVQLLLDYGADVRMRDLGRKTALEVARNSGSREPRKIVRLLSRHSPSAQRGERRRHV